MRKSRTLLLPKVRLNASHRATDRETHPTHWPAADRQDFQRMQSGCDHAEPPELCAVPSLVADARRMRAEDRQ